MKNNIKEFLKNITLLRSFVFWGRDKKRIRTYSQNGEDLILALAFKHLHIEHPTYLDIGANKPFKGNNTALFYKRGAHGINIEPDPSVFSELARKRKRDINLNVGISG